MTCLVNKTAPPLSTLKSMVKSVSMTLGMTFQFLEHILGVLLLLIVDAGIVSLSLPTHSVKYCAHGLFMAQNVALIFPHIPL